MEKFANFTCIPRAQWEQLAKNKRVPLTKAELDHLKAFNDPISLADVRAIYLPLCRYIHLHFQDFQQNLEHQRQFLQTKSARTPFIIGISGSVSVGKTTTARLLQFLLAYFYPRLRVQMMTTDGFLYSNRELRAKDLYNEKGFPASYNMPKLIKFLKTVKKGQHSVRAPLFSHDSYDVIPNKFELINRPDILIIEGINVLQSPLNQALYISDFTDFSIYIDARADLIEGWYLDRFKKLMRTALQNPKNYYHDLVQSNPQGAIKMAKRAWDEINLPNLKQNILPGRDRADLILHKSVHHRIDEVAVRQY